MIDDLFPELHVLSIPMRNTFRGIDTREVVIFRGPHGWSEFSPFVEYGEAEAVVWMRAALEAANNPWPTLHRTKIKANATLPIVDPKRVPAILDRYHGCTTVKIKVDTFEVGSQLVEATLNHIPDAKIRLDVNGGWRVDEARNNLLEFHLRFGEVFEYIEQPCEKSNELREIHKDSPIKIAADESIRKNIEGDLEGVKEFADVAILKWQPLGGFAATHRIAKRIGLPVVISSALETGVGISHSLALAASFESLEFACGLGTTSLFEADICGDQFAIKNGFIQVETAFPNEIDRFIASPDRTTWWHNRLMKVAELL